MQNEEIKVNKNPLKPNVLYKLDIEMKRVDTQELSCYRTLRILCSPEIIGVIMLVVILGGGHFFVAYRYNLLVFREGIWVFIALVSLSCFLALSFMARICIAIQPKKTKKSGDFKNIGGFGAISSIPKNLKSPHIVTSTDGVGTKLEIANEIKKFNTIGIDLVAMCVNDLIVQG